MKYKVLYVKKEFFGKLTENPTPDKFEEVCTQPGRCVAKDECGGRE